MKKNTVLLFLLIVTLLYGGCRSNTKKTAETKEANTIVSEAVADTGYTGIRRYSSKGKLVKEVTFKNGLREGLMKTFNVDGQLYQTFWYVKGLIQDTAKLYFPDGKVFRTTPFKNDSVDGTQTQYYGSGKVRAILKYVNGLRTPFLEEFSSNGTKITGYPDLVVRTKDEYKQNGTFKIYLELTDKTVKANFYRGEFTYGLFDTKRCAKINNTETTGYLELIKMGNPDKNYVGIIAEVLTPLGNRNLVYKKVDLKYNDLK